MVLVWQNYQTDAGFNYPFLSVIIEQISELGRDVSPFLVLPNSDRSQAIDIDLPCNVSQITQRSILLFFADSTIYRVSYFRPFNRDLFDRLTNLSDVRAFEFIGERIRYSRLRKMLDRNS